MNFNKRIIKIDDINKYYLHNLMVKAQVENTKNILFTKYLIIEIAIFYSKCPFFWWL